MITKTFTELESKNITDSQAKRIILAFGDGQDTYIKTLYDYQQDNGTSTYLDAVDEAYFEYGGNMVELRWIENNELQNLILE